MPQGLPRIAPTDPKKVQVDELLAEIMGRQGAGEPMAPSGGVDATLTDMEMGAPDLGQLEGATDTIAPPGGVTEQFNLGAAEAGVPGMEDMSAMSDPAFQELLQEYVRSGRAVK